MNNLHGDMNLPRRLSDWRESFLIEVRFHVGLEPEVISTQNAVVLS